MSQYDDHTMIQCTEWVLLTTSVDIKSDSSSEYRILEIGAFENLSKTFQLKTAKVAYY